MLYVFGSNTISNSQILISPNFFLLRRPIDILGKWAKPVVKPGSIGDIDQTFNSAVFVHKYESWSKNMTSSDKGI